MRKALVAGAAFALLVFVPAAQAKEMVYTGACGATGCKSIKPAIAVSPQGLPGAVVPPLQSYYVLQTGYGDGHKIFVRGAQYFIVDAGTVIGKDVAGPNDGWAKLPDRTLAALRTATSGLQPFPAPMPARAYVGTQRMPDARALASLLGPLPPVAMPHTGESPIPIGLEWAKPNPWTTAGALLSYLPKARVVIRIDGYFRVPTSVADRIDRARR
jgi:hypothetical protein